MIFRILIFIASLLVAIGADAEKPALKVGVVLFLTNNDYMSIASEFKRGIELAEVEGGVTVIVEDDQGVNKHTVTAVQKLLQVDKVQALMLAEYVQVQSGGPLAMNARVPTVVFWESSPDITAVGEYMFGIGYWQPLAGALPARFAAERLKAKSAALIYDVSAYSNRIATSFKEEFIKLGGKIILEETHPREDTDFRSSIAKARSRNPDILFAPVSEHPATFFKQLGRSGFKRPVLSSDQISQEFIDAAEGGLEGVYFCNADDRLSPELESLADKYRVKYGEPSGSIHMVGLAYDALRLLVKSSEDAGGRELVQALKQVKDYPGVLGPITVNSDRSFPRPEVMYVVKNGKAEHVEF